jgi:hypothetical protein
MLRRSLRSVFLQKIHDEMVIFVLVFPREHLKVTRGVAESVVETVLGRSRLAFRRCGTGGFLSVCLIGYDLCLR